MKFAEQIYGMQPPKNSRKIQKKSSTFAQPKCSLLILIYQTNTSNMLESFRISSTRRLCRRHFSFQFHRHWSKPSFLPSLDGQRCSLEASIHVNSVKLVSFQHFERSRLARRRHQLHPWIWSTYRRRKKSKNLFLTFLIFIF